MLKQKKQKLLSEGTKKTIIFFIICALTLIGGLGGFISGISLATSDILTKALLTFLFTLLGLVVIPLSIVLLCAVFSLVVLIIDDIF